MNVLPFPAPAHCEPGWRQSELEQLIRLCSANDMGGSAHTWAVDSTEAGDPQFYVLGPDPRSECVLCISRVHRTYVLEDGLGALLLEDRTLRNVVTYAKRSLVRTSAAWFSRMFVVLCGIRSLVDEKLDPILPDSAEMVTRFAPQLAAMI